MPIALQLLIALVASTAIGLTITRLENGRWVWQEYTPENPFTWQRFCSPF